MLDRPVFDEATAKGRRTGTAASKPGLLSVLGERMLAMGAKIALIKLGDCGAYLRTAEATVLSGMGRAQPADLDVWGDQRVVGAMLSGAG